MHQRVYGEIPVTSLLSQLKTLCGVVYRCGTLQQQQQAALCQVYQLALQDRFTEAQDLLLMTHLQERVSTAGVETMILFNRAMTQLGLAAFRSGVMVYAHNCLDDLVNTGSRNGVLRVLLGQGSDVTHDQRPGEEEMRVNEERRKLPPHMVETKCVE